MTVLTPLAALVVLAALLPAVAMLLGQRRVAAVRSALGLTAPPRRARAVRLAAGTAGIALLGLAAAQPALTTGSRTDVRKDVEVLFVVDTSRSMAASAKPTSPTRLDRAVEAAISLRASIPTVASGIATFTDRVLPDLLPVPDADAFDAVARRSVQIESPPPTSSSARATTYSALADVPAGNYFTQAIKHRIVVLLTDGESNPVSVGGLAEQFGPSGQYRLLAVHVWGAREAVYDSDGSPERAYQPDPTSRALLADFATTLGGRSFEAKDLGGAERYLHQLVGNGPTVPSSARRRTTTALAPYVAALALLLVVAAVLPGHWSPRRVRSLTR